jgi:hypothetical protein
MPPETKQISPEDEAFEDSLRQDADEYEADLWAENDYFESEGE